VKFTTQLGSSVGGSQLDNDIGNVVRNKLRKRLLLGRTLELLALLAFGFGRENGRHFAVV
jgi:hypothetical protein